MKSEFLNNSICKDCEHLNKRIIKVKDLNSFLDEHDMLDQLDEDDYDESFEAVLESFICKELNIELDHYVLECNSYSKKQRKNILNSKKILKDLTWQRGKGD